ncbi:conserved hypothetical protein [Thermotomaculum hydrothermale]|uniref:UPF0102 protein TTHT_0061 n=1 Tax=Thermotomaculum hydrothermale TaxID=981385 RepID=A0A7R6SYB6_9BACT|nr:YraN family protein [Thermotomaculum hydrothermale]BBB31710.1 conserved hypothetical protein [Thermotomaculum hydrothermale]
MRLKGFLWEKVSAVYLFLKGFKILEFNYRTRFGEIDIVCRDKDSIVFVEVKYRKSEKFGRAEEFVTESKRKKIIMAAKQYVVEKNIDTNIRFDVVAINGFKINHIKNAFEGE